MAKQYHLRFIRPYMSPEMSRKVFALLCIYRLQCGFFNVSVGVMASSLLILAVVSTGSVFFLDKVTVSLPLISIFTRSLAFVLGWICTFRTITRSSLGHRTRLVPEHYASSRHIYT